MKKIVKLNGKTYLFDESTKSMEEVEGGEGKVETETVKEEEQTEEIDAAAKSIIKSLGLEDLRATVAKLAEKDSKNSKTSELINFEKLMNKSVDQMTAKEKILGFFQAIVQSNHAVLKALSEGSAADGGYLFPDEFRAEVIRDVMDTPHMRNEVTVIPMKRDIMKIPTLTSGPVVTWTEENAVKSTTSAHFNEATLTVKKMAAINA